MPHVRSKILVGALMSDKGSVANLTSQTQKLEITYLDLKIV